MGDVEIEPWSEDDLELLRQLNQPSVRAYTGGTETDDQVVVRQGRYLRGPVRGAGQMFAVVLQPERVKVGSVGYWPRVWHDQPVYEMGWAVLPEFQGRGIATAAVRAVVDAARARGDRRWAHAYPSVDNPPSNAVCRKAGFELVGPTDFEYPPGQLMRSNDWRLDLKAPADG